MRRELVSGRAPDACRGRRSCAHVSWALSSLAQSAGKGFQDGQVSGNPEQNVQIRSDKQT